MWAREHEFDDAVQRAATRYGVPAPLILATIGVESGFRPDALNEGDPGGAWGLMQMIPATARGLGYPGPMQALLSDPGLAIELGTRLLAQNLAATAGSVADSVSAYNGGFRPSLGYSRVRADGTYANQAYVDRVLAAYRYFGGEAASVDSPSFPPASLRGHPGVDVPPGSSEVT